MLSSLHAHFQRQRSFYSVLLLFVSFRLLAIVTLRTGGLISDFSDYDFYQIWGELGAMGYRTYENLWTAYPPLFPAIMLRVFELSARIPPWIDHRFAFHLLFGLTLLLFESGNLVLIYRLAGKLHADETALNPGESAGIEPALWAAILYALLFVPAYTMLGWFEPLPLFFMLLGLDLLLQKQRWGWTGSAVAAALGFLVKLTPALLVPIAIRRLGAKLSWHALRDEWFDRRSPGNLLRPTLYVLIFGGVVLVIGFMTTGSNAALAFSSFRIQSIRPPWQSVWALIDGYYGYGLVPLDMRNLVAFENRVWESRIPWRLVTALFLLLYLWLYTRPYDWARARTSIAFAAISVIWLFLYSKGWSPQFLVWILTFIVLLLPTPRGLLLAITLSIINVVEAYLFLIILPDERWLMAGTVLLRTGLLLGLAVELVAQIWPQTPARKRLHRIGAGASWALMATAVVAGLLAAPPVARAYGERRMAENPCREVISFLREEAEKDSPTVPLVMAETALWRELYPWLRQTNALRVVDTYSPIDEPPATVAANKLDIISADGEFWWVERMPSPAFARYFTRPDVQILEEQMLGDCSLTRVLRTGDNIPLATAEVEGGPIVLLESVVRPDEVGESLDIVLYWQAESPVQASYTVFTQLFNDQGALVGQQDNLPVRGLAPTDTWQTGKIVRDPYQLSAASRLPPGAYTLYIGLYNEQGRRSLRLPDGTIADHVAFSVHIER